MVSVTMPAPPPPPPYKPETGLVTFAGGASMREQIYAYYEAHFRTGPHMAPIETFAQFVLEKGHGAMAPQMRIDGKLIIETWQARGRRLFGQRFVAVMEQAINEYRAAHAAEARPAPATAPLEEPPAHILEEIPEPDF